MSDTPKDDEAKFNDTLRRMLNTPPKPQKPKPEQTEKPKRAATKRTGRPEKR